MTLNITPYIETPRCDVRRPKTAARCEMKPDHDDPWHVGRDTAGRFHSWKVDR